MLLRLHVWLGCQADRVVLPQPAGCFFSSRRRHTRCLSDWSSDVCSSDVAGPKTPTAVKVERVISPLVPSHEAAPSIPTPAKNKAASFILSPGEFGAVPALPCVDPDFRVRHPQFRCKRSFAGIRIA